MENIPRGSDGRRLFTPEFKREQVARLVRGELTLTELSREPGLSPAGAVPGDPEGVGAVGATDQGLGRGTEPLHDRVRRASAEPMKRPFTQNS